MVGGSLDPSVPRSAGVTLQEGRAAHGPLHPAVTSPPKLCWFCVWFLLGFSGMDVGYSVWFSWSLGLECLVYRPLGPDPCMPRYMLSPLSLLCSVFSSAPFRSLSLSLRCWGNPNPFWGLGFPLCFFIMDAHYDLDPFVFTFSFTNVPAPPCVCVCCFFFVGARVSVCLAVCVGFVLGGFLGSCLGRFLLRCMQNVTNALLGKGRETRYLPPFLGL